jgi:hypothetical protein
MSMVKDKNWWMLGVKCWTLDRWMPIEALKVVSSVVACRVPRSLCCQDTNVAIATFRLSIVWPYDRNRRFAMYVFLISNNYK